MKIKLKTTLASASHTGHPGQIIEMPDDEAEALIKGDFAEPVHAKKPGLLSKLLAKNPEEEPTGLPEHWVEEIQDIARAMVEEAFPVDREAEFQAAIEEAVKKAVPTEDEFQASFEDALQKAAPLDALVERLRGLISGLIQEELAKLNAPSNETPEAAPAQQTQESTAADEQAKNQDSEPPTDASPDGKKSKK